MKNHPRFSMRSFFFVFFLCNSLLSSKSILTAEIVEILNEQLSDGNLAYSQVQYIINELNLEPNCLEISNLFKYFKISTPEIQNLVQLHCHKAKKAKITNCKQGDQLKKVKLRVSYRDKIQPKYEKQGQNLTSIKAEIGQTQLKYQKKSDSKISSFRSLKYKGCPVEFETGDLYLKKGLSFVNGRNFWPGHSSQQENQGILFSSSNRYNGIQSSFQHEKFKFNGYGIWNKNEFDKQDIDAVLMGGTGRYDFKMVSVTGQSQLNSLDRMTGPEEKFLISGVQVKGTPQYEYALGLGHSVYQPAWTGARRQTRSGYYAEASYRFYKEKTGLNIFQSSSSWKNPLMDLNKKYTETTEHGTQLRGGGEGGIEFQSDIPLSTQKIKTGLNLRSKVHWFSKNTNLKYRQHSLSLYGNWESLKHVFKIQTTTTDSTDFLSLNPTLNFKAGPILPGLSYSHKFGDYRGEYPRKLTIQALFLKGAESRYKIQLKWKDIIDKRDNIRLYFFQRWDISNNLHIENNLFVPLEHWQISKDLYYKIIFRSNLVL